MKIVFLGTNGFYPAYNRDTGCVFFPDRGLAFDAGTGIRNIGKYIKTPFLDIVLTHAHLDHVIGLTYLIGLMDVKQVPVTVYATDKVIEAVDTHLFADALFPVKYLHFKPLSEAPIVSFNLPHHPGGSHGFTILFEQLRVNFVTDTTADPSYLDCIEKSDLLIHECYYRKGSQHGHTSAEGLVQFLSMLQHKPKRLALYHLNPSMNEDDLEDLAYVVGKELPMIDVFVPQEGWPYIY